MLEPMRRFSRGPTIYVIKAFLIYVIRKNQENNGEPKFDFINVWPEGLSITLVDKPDARHIRHALPQELARGSKIRIQEGDMWYYQGSIKYRRS